MMVLSTHPPTPNIVTLSLTDYDLDLICLIVWVSIRDYLFCPEGEVGVDYFPSRK